MAIVMFASFALLVCVSVVTDSCAASSVNVSEELVRELATAAKTIGNDELAQQLWLHGAACLGYRAIRVWDASVLGISRTNPRIQCSFNGPCKA